MWRGPMLVISEGPGVRGISGVRGANILSRSGQHCRERTTAGRPELVAADESFDV